LRFRPVLATSSALRLRQDDDAAGLGHIDTGQIGRLGAPAGILTHPAMPISSAGVKKTAGFRRV
jgi:hypothetical protein